MTVLEILTVLFNDIVEGLSRFGCGMVGLPYPENDPALGPVDANGNRRPDE